MTLEVGGRVLATDAEGYLLDLNAWQPAVAEAMARADHQALTPAHWEIIHFLREYYREFGHAPPVRLLTRAIAKRLGPDKGTTRYLYDLFPYGPGKQACRYAGLPKPSGCF